MISEETKPDLTPEVQAITTRAEQLLVVTNGDQRTALAEFVLDVDAMMKRISEHHDPDIKRANELHKSMIDTKNKLYKPLEQIKDKARRAIGQYDFAEQRKAEQAAAIMRAEMQKAAVHEVVETAVALDQAGLKDDAEAMMAAPPPPVVVVAEPDIPKVHGVATTTAAKVPYDFRVTNPALIPREFLMVNEAAIRGVVKALRENTKIPGVEVFPNPSARITGKR